MKPTPRIWLFLILFAGFALRIYRLGAASLWYDETVSLFLARQDLTSLTLHTAGDIHPPLYYYLLHFWGLAAGWSEFSTAFLSLFFGVLLIALVYHVAREWIDQTVALIAAFLVAISPYNLWYSQEVRMYTLGATLGLASVYFFVRMFDLNKDLRFQISDFRFFISRYLIAYVIISALGMYTLYYFVFLLAFENLVAVIWFSKRFLDSNHNLESKTLHLKSEVLFWILSQFAIFFLFLPWLSIAFRQATDPPVPPWRSFTPFPNILLESFSALALGQSVDPAVMLPVLLIIVAILFTALIRNRGQLVQDERHKAITPLFLLAYTLVPLSIIYALSIWKPLYHVRYIFTYSAGFYILLAIGINKIINYKLPISRSLVTAGVFVFFTIVSGYSDYNFWFNPQYAHDDLRGAVKRISESWRPGDAVLVNAGYTYTAFAYYFDQPIGWRGRLTNYPPTNVSIGTIQRLVDEHSGVIVLQTGSINGGASLGWGSAESDFYATTTEETRTALDRVFATYRRIWMLRLYDTVVDPDGVVRDYLAQHGRLIEDQVFSGESNMRTQGYLTSRTPMITLPPSAVPRQILLGNRITFLGFEPAELSVHAGEPIDVNLYWRAKEATNADMHIFIGLFTEDGALVASTSEQPLGNGLGTSRWGPDEVVRQPVRLIAPKNIQRGNYILRIVMYNPFTNEPWEAEMNEWVTQGSQIKTVNVRIE